MQVGTVVRATFPHPYQSQDTLLVDSVGHGPANEHSIKRLDLGVQEEGLGAGYLKSIEPGV
jgi:hypothetical protein